MSDAPDNRLVDVAVIVPAHNEAPGIETLTRQLRALTEHVLVIDDGSTDDTARIAERSGVNVLRHPARLGKGAAIRDGFLWSLDRPVAWVALIDGDNQHTVTDLKRLAAFARQSGCDLALGQRPFTRAMPFERRVTNFLMSTVIRMVTRRAIADSQCGLRVITAAAARRLVPTSTGFEVESEMIIRAARLGMTMGLLPIETLYPPGWKSSIRPVGDLFRWLRFVAGLTR